ncbi:MAG: ThuA domain-containing protein [Sedimentisphaerales bacterium]|nr:ThuA domain-containing protein [Sedimentisphaerales bacterium]
MKKALFVWGGYEDHEPKKCVDIMAPLLEAEGYDVELADSLSVFDDREKLMGLDLIIPTWTGGEFTGDQEWNITDAVKLNGVGIGGWHGGLCDSFRKHTWYQFMTGGQFVAHPGGGGRKYTVNIIKPDDPIVAGISDFEMESEQYYMHVDPLNEVLATATHIGTDDAPWTKGGVVPVVWKKTYGAGKVFYSSLGHNAKDFEVPEMKEILRRGLIWATK